MAELSIEIKQGKGKRSASNGKLKRSKMVASVNYEFPENTYKTVTTSYDFKTKYYLNGKQVSENDFLASMDKEE
jgi:hypothetical protein